MKNEVFLDKYHRQLIKIRNRLLTYKDCCDRKRLTYVLQTGEEIAKKDNYSGRYPNWKEILERWKKDKYDSYYFLPDNFKEYYTHKIK